LLRYLGNLAAGKVVLWCFLVWYLVTIYQHFDPTPGIWLNALGISAIIGIALYLSVREPGKPPPDRWTVLRLFLMPFCVSSFSQLIKGKGFILVFAPGWRENAVASAFCAAFVLLAVAARALSPAKGNRPGQPAP
jgi:hypothetical protein